MTLNITTDMTNEQWKGALTQFFDECIGFWRREGRSMDDAVYLAKEDCIKIKRNPYSPKGEPIPDDILEWYHNLLISSVSGTL